MVEPSFDFHKMNPDEIRTMPLIPLGDGQVCDARIITRVLRPSLTAVGMRYLSGQTEIPYDYEAAAQIRGGGGVSDSGYIGINHDFRDVVAAQKQTIESIGATNEQVLERLQRCYEVQAPLEDYEQVDVSGLTGFESLELLIFGSLNRTDAPPIELNFEKNGGGLQDVAITYFKGETKKIGSPLRTPVRSHDIQLQTQGKKPVLVSAMHEGFIEKYGFYESCAKPVIHDYANFPGIVDALGLNPLPLEELSERYKNTLDGYTQQRARNAEMFDLIAKELPISWMLIIPRDQLPSHRSNQGWLDRADEMAKIPTQKDNAKRVRELVEELDAEGIKIGDLYTNWYFHRYHSFPGETPEEKRDFYYQRKLTI